MLTLLVAGAAPAQAATASATGSVLEQSRAELLAAIAPLGHGQSTLDAIQAAAGEGYQSEAAVIATCFALFGGTGVGIALCVAVAAALIAACLSLKKYRQLPCFIAA